MLKKLTIAAATASVVFSLALPAFAQDSRPTNTNSPAGTVSTNSSYPNKGESTAKKSAMAACVKAAVDKRAAAVSTAKDAYIAALKAAADARKAALDATKALTDKTQKKQAVKDANAAWRTARQSARKAWTDARKAALDRYKTDREACESAQ